MFEAGTDREFRIDWNLSQICNNAFTVSVNKA